MDAHMKNEYRKAAAWRYLKRLRTTGLLTDEEYRRASDLLTRRYLTAA